MPGPGSPASAKGHRAGPGCEDPKHHAGVSRRPQAGLDHAFGDIVISMDADLQHPPELIPELVEKWEEGNHRISCFFFVFLFLI